MRAYAKRVAAARRRSRSNARCSGQAPSVWTVWIRGSRRSAPSATRLAQRAGCRRSRARRRRPGRRGGRARAGAASSGPAPSRASAALDREAVQVALAGERQRARRERLEQAVVGRVAGSPGSRGQTTTSRRAARSRSSTTGSASGGTKTRARARPPPRRRPPRARRCRSSRSRARAARRARPAEPLGDLELEEHAEQVPGLVRAGDVAGLVLDPDAAAAEKPSRR